jgi:DNA-binding LytR/AlgR family response regulator
MPEINPDFINAANNSDFTTTDSLGFTKIDAPGLIEKNPVQAVTNIDFYQTPVISKKTMPDTTTSSDDTTRPPVTTNLPSDRITVRSGQKIKIIPIEDIIYIKADGDYISIKASEGNWLKEQTMKYTEDILPTDHFVRIHRSYIVNVNHISRIERYGEKQQVVLHNNEKIKISAARYQTLRQVLGF